MKVKIKILENRGIYSAGAEVEMEYPQGQQWVNSGYAEMVLEAPKPKAKPKKVAKPKVVEKPIEAVEKAEEPEANIKESD